MPTSECRKELHKKAHLSKTTVLALQGKSPGTRSPGPIVGMHSSEYCTRQSIARYSTSCRTDLPAVTSRGDRRFHQTNPKDDLLLPFYAQT